MSDCKEGANTTKLSCGLMVTSIDLELAWGTFHRGWHRTHEKVLLKGRETVGKLLELFQRYAISATWAIVGHVFLESCERRENLAHPEMPRAKRPRLQGEDWYAQDPCTDRYRDPLWYGPDLVEKILQCSVPQEVASHSFSHTVFPKCGPEVARAELAACLEQAKRYGITLRSFVFPQDRPAHLDLLKEAGFVAYRGPTASLFQDVRPRWLGKSKHFLDDLLVWPVACVSPREVLPGLWELPGSMMYGFMLGIRQLIPVRTRIRKAKEGIERAIQDRKIFHLWFHPEMLGYRDRELLEGLEAIYAYADQKRREGVLQIVTIQKALACWRQGRSMSSSNAHGAVLSADRVTP